MNSPFKNFEMVMGPLKSSGPVPIAVATLKKKKIPDPLIEHWLNVGWGGCSDGFFWLTDPDQFSSLFGNGSLILPNVNQDDPPVVFARTGIGDLFLWLDSNVYYLNTYWNYLAKITPSITVFLEQTLCDENFRVQVLREKIFRAAQPRLGIPHIDECYAYVPHPAIGGDGSSDSLNRDKMYEYLVIVGCSCGPIRPYRG